MDEILFSLEGKKQRVKHLNFSELEQNIGLIIGQNLKKYREQRGYTQHQHAELLGVSISQYRKYESGIDIPKYHTLCRWTLLTGCSLYCLIRGSQYSDLFPDQLTSWRLTPFNFLLGRLKQEPFNALLQLIYSLGFVEDVHVFKTLPEPNQMIDIEAAFEQIEQGTYLIIAKNLRQFRAEQELSQEHIADLIGVNLNTYRSYESLTSPPKFSYLIAIRFILVFGRHMSSLMPDTYFASFLRHYIHRLSHIAPILYAVSDAQHKQLETIFKSIEGIAKDNPLYLF